MATIEQFIIEKVAEYDPAISTAEGSLFYEKVLRPLRKRLGPEFPDTDVVRFLEEVLDTNHPEVYRGADGAFHDMVMMPVKSFLDPVRRNAEETRTRVSIANYASLTTAEMDDLVANFITERESGERASGSVRLYCSTPRSVTITVANRVIGKNGKFYYPLPSIQKITSLEMAVNVENGLYYMDVIVAAEAEGPDYEIGPDEITAITGIAVAAITNKYSISGGITGQSNADLYQDIVTARSFGNSTSAGGIARLFRSLTWLQFLSVVGYGDPEMRRDMVTGTALITLSGIPGGFSGGRLLDTVTAGTVHVGGHQDVYVKSSNITKRSLLIKNLSVPATASLYGSVTPTFTFSGVVHVTISRVDGSAPVTCVFQETPSESQVTAALQNAMQLTVQGSAQLHLGKYLLTGGSSGFILSGSLEALENLFGLAESVTVRTAPLDLTRLVAIQNGSPFLINTAGDYDTSGDPVIPDTTGAPLIDFSLVGDPSTPANTRTGYVVNTGVNIARENVALPLIDIEAIEIVKAGSEASYSPKRYIEYAHPVDLRAYNVSGATQTDASGSDGYARLFFRYPTRTVITQYTVFQDQHGRRYAVVYSDSRFTPQVLGDEAMFAWTVTPDDMTLQNGLYFVDVPIITATGWDVPYITNAEAHATTPSVVTDRFKLETTSGTPASFVDGDILELSGGSSSLEVQATLCGKETPTATDTGWVVAVKTLVTAAEYPSGTTYQYLRPDPLEPSGYAVLFSGALQAQIVSRGISLTLTQAEMDTIALGDYVYLLDTRREVPGYSSNIIETTVASIYGNRVGLADFIRYEADMTFAYTAEFLHPPLSYNLDDDTALTVPLRLKQDELIYSTWEGLTGYGYEYGLLPVDPSDLTCQYSAAFTFSLLERVGLRFSKTVFNGSTETTVNGSWVKLHYKTVPVLQEAQDLVSGDARGDTCADTLVRHYLPAHTYVTPTFTGGNAAVITLALKNKILALRPEDGLDTHVINTFLKEQGATAVTNPIDLVCVVLQQDRTYTTLRSQNKILTEARVYFAPVEAR